MDGNNAFLCDVESGICVVPGSGNEIDRREPADLGAQEVMKGSRARVTYVTDPICSACWLMEPAWRSLVERYGDAMEIQHVYGGLLPGWRGFSDPGAGIYKPEDVAPHWDDFSRRSGQPIDSSVWWTDPIASSFPPSIAAAAVRLLEPAKEGAFLRRIRELLFLDARNIARRDILGAAATAVGVDEEKFARLIDDGTARTEFERDLALARSLGVRGFPTVILEGESGRVVLHGWVPPSRLEEAFLTVSGLGRRSHVASLTEAAQRLGTGSTLEYATLLGIDRAAAEPALTAAGLARRSVGTGHVWTPREKLATTQPG